MSLPLAFDPWGGVLGFVFYAALVLIVIGVVPALCGLPHVSVFGLLVLALWVLILIFLGVFLGLPVDDSDFRVL